MKNSYLIKKSDVIFLIFIINAIMFFIETEIIGNILIRIQAIILFIGYFIVKQLEENGEGDIE